MHRYEQLAQELEALIASGQLRPGDRLPSVREAKARRAVSASTVFQAYQALEARGLVQARPQSGFYVAAVAGTAARRPRPSLPPQRTSAVAVSELVFEVLGAARSPGVAPLGSAFPGPGLFPLGKLARSAAIGMGQLDPHAVVTHLSPGSERLREQIALRYRLNGVAVDATEVIVTNGALEGLNAGLQVVTEPGDTVVVESPTFYGALQALERLHLRALEVRTDPATGLDLEALETALDNHRVAACWLMPSFQNPLGSLMPDAARAALVELLARRGVPLIEDDAYAELYFGSQRPKPAKAWDSAGLVLHCSSFSKCLAPGYRVGWIAAGRFVQQVHRLTLMTTMGASLPAQLAVQHYLDQGGYERHLRRLRRRLAEQGHAVARAIEATFPRGTRFTTPSGGYFIWVELPRGLDAMALQRLALAEGIAIAPGQIFSPDHRFRHGLRINTGHPAEVTLPAVARVGELAHQLGRKPQQ